MRELLVKVFISWSGALSRDVAVALRDWLPSVIQVVEPYVSSEDIDPGARWSTDIAVQLEDTDFGILCVTRDNVETPWLNFEAGALSKSVETSRVVPFLVDLGPSDIPRGPLAQFQAVRPTRTGILRLIRGINDFCGALSPERVEGTVDVWWPHLEEILQEVQQGVQLVTEVAPQRPTADMLAELLELTRGLQRELQDRGATTGTRWTNSLAPQGYVYEAEALEVVSSIARQKGFQVVQPGNRTSRYDLKLERGDRTLYVEASFNRVPQTKIEGILKWMHRSNIKDPLLLIVQGPISESWIATLDPRVHVIQWQNPADNNALATTLEQLGNNSGTLVTGPLPPRQG
jgi:TIR domain